MGALPVVSGREVVAALERAGWRLDRQRGSHMILVKPEAGRSISIPDHRTVAKGTLRQILRSSNITVDEFLGLL